MLGVAWTLAPGGTGRRARQPMTPARTQTAASSEPAKSWAEPSVASVVTDAPVREAGAEATPRGRAHGTVRFQGDVRAQDPQELEIVLAPLDPALGPPMARFVGADRSFDFGSIERAQWSVQVRWNRAPLGISAMQGVHGCGDFHGTGTSQTIDLAEASESRWTVFVGTQLRGVVVEAASRQPVTGAWIDDSVETGVDGAFEFWVPAERSFRRRFVSAPGFARAAFPLHSAPRPLLEAVVVELEPETRLAGVIRRSDGSPRANMRVFLHHDGLLNCYAIEQLEDDPRCLDSAGHVWRAKTGRDGAFQLVGLPVLPVERARVRIDVFDRRLRPVWQGHAVAHPSQPPFEIILPAE